MKAIMISIKPKWVAKILNGEKTIEVRKKFPKDYVGWVYLYCSKSNTQYLVGSKTQKCEIITKSANARFSPNIDKYTGNGKVVARFWCDKVEEITPFEEYESPFGMAYKLTKDKIVCCQKAQLTYDEYNHYLKGKNGYAIYISNLKIFDKPKELSEFSAFRKPYWNKKTKEFIKEEQKMFGCRIFRVSRLKPLTKAPQNFCYVEVE